MKVYRFEHKGLPTEVIISKDTYEVLVEYCGDCEYTSLISGSLESLEDFDEWFIQVRTLLSEHVYEEDGLYD